MLVLCCVGSRLSDELIIRSDESYRVCVCVRARVCCVCACVRVSNCVWSRNLNNETDWARV